MKTVKSNTELSSRSMCDSGCIFTIAVIERKGVFATVKYMGAIKKTKVYSDSDGNEYLRPEKYSMAPIFRAN